MKDLKAGCSFSGLGYKWLIVLVIDFASIREAKNLCRFSEVGENQQLLKANVVLSCIVKKTLKLHRFRLYRIFYLF